MRWVTAKPRQGPGPRRLRLRPCPQARRTACAGPKWDRVADPFVTYQPRPWVRSSESRSKPPAATRRGRPGSCREGGTQEPRGAGANRPFTPNAWKTRPEPGRRGGEGQERARLSGSLPGRHPRERRGGSGARRGRRAGRGSRGRAGAAPGCRYHIPPQSGARGMAPPPRALPLCPFLPDLPSLPRVLQATEAKVSA